MRSPYFQLHANFFARFDALWCVQFVYTGQDLNTYAEGDRKKRVNMDNWISQKLDASKGEHDCQTAVQVRELTDRVGE